MLAPPDRREVAMTAGGDIYLDGAPVSMEQLTERLAEMQRLYPDLGVVVRADGTVQHQDVVELYGAITRAGVADMAIAARTQPGQLR